MRQTNWKVRDLRAALRAIGCELKRTCGSHEIWCLPDGRSLPPFVGKKPNDDVSPNVLSSIRRFFEQAGIAAEL